MNFDPLPYLRPRFSFLLEERGFELRGAKYDAEHFGNFYIDLSSNDFLFRLTNDRDVQSSFLAPLSEPGKWYDVPLVRSFFLKLDPTGTNTLDDEAAFIKMSYEQLETAFSKENWPSTRRKLEVFGEMRARKMFPSLYEKQ